VFPGSSLTGEGVYEALDWLKKEISRRRLQNAVTQTVAKAVPASLTSALKAKLKLFMP
jgi:hypothetical protein